jgi:hypothetical protein
MPDHPPPLILNIGEILKLLSRLLITERICTPRLSWMKHSVTGTMTWVVLFVEAAIRISPVIEAKRHLDFVAVIIGIIHPDGRENIDLNMADFRNCSLNLLLFIKELGGIGILLKQQPPQALQILQRGSTRSGEGFVNLMSDFAKELAVPPIS